MTSFLNSRSSACGLESAERADQDHISSLLCRWHKWAAGEQYVYGYPVCAPGFDQCTVSRQYDDENGALDAVGDVVLMEAVNSLIATIPQPWHTALSIQARNLSVGVAVWTSVRLPSCPLERATILADARNKFKEKLQGAKLM